MRRKLLACVAMLSLFSVLTGFKYQSTIENLQNARNVAEMFEQNLIDYSKTGSWQYSGVPESLPQGADYFEVPVDAPKGKCPSEEILYFYSLDGDYLYQMHNGSVIITIASYSDAGNVEQVSSWRVRDEK